LLTLLIGFVSGALPIIFFGGDAIILATATSLAGVNIGMLIFNLVD
jgi:hypothetical protein